jgi:Outer membrane lipoprotein-sorting protein
MNKSIPGYAFFTLLCMVCPLVTPTAQTITTADSFFSAVSDTYANIKDYSASISITSISGQKTETMSGRAVFKKPDLLRIDFTNPDQQTIVFNGEFLTIYLPTYNVVLNQSVDKGSGSSGASLATPQGLSLMKRYYSVAYETGPDPVALGDDSKEQVVVLSLLRRSTTEMFRSIRLMVSPDTKLIRRIDARTISGDQIRFEFSGYALNQGILDNRFVYDSPASANMFNDFLFIE